MTETLESIDALVTTLNDEIWEILEGKPVENPVTFGTDGNTQWIDFLGQTIWDSGDGDTRDIVPVMPNGDGTGEEPEDLESYIRRKITDFSVSIGKVRL